MANGTFTLKRQIGGRGAFAKVSLDVQSCVPPNRIEVAASGNIAIHYIPAAKTGVQFAWTQLLLENQNPPNVIVTIHEIIESPADTLEMMVVYAAANAFCDALELTLLRPIEFDGEHHQIVFPLGRPTGDKWPKKT